MAGPVLGAKIKAFGGAVNKLDPKQLLAEMSANGKIVLNLNGEDTDITSDMVAVNVNAKEGFSAAQEGDVCVILDTNLTPELVDEGLSREFISKVQQMRKAPHYKGEAQSQHCFFKLHPGLFGHPPDIADRIGPLNVQFFAFLISLLLFKKHGQEVFVYAFLFIVRIFPDIT